jgi:S-adenosylmethionine-diacylglycerol 3-amino-3-carboxypropyl transferase
MSRSYFNKLNYTLANEDTSLEVSMLRPGLEHVVSVAGSGGRAMPLLAAAPKQLTCIDLSNEQLYLTELRMEALKALTHEEYLRFWGYPIAVSGTVGQTVRGPAEPSERRALFGRVKLSPAAEAFLRGQFENAGWESILYAGKWETTFAKISVAVRRIVGTRGLMAFSALTQSEHDQYMEAHFPTRAWGLAVSLLGNASVFNSLLYKGHFPKRNIPGSSYAFYQSVFARIFAQGPLRRNFLLQLLFFGKIVFADGNPVECNPEVFAKAKAAAAQTEIRYVQGNVVERIAEMPGASVDFVSLSDVPSYFSGDTETRYLQHILPALSAQGQVVVRNYLRVPEGTDLSGYRNVTERYRAAIDRETVQMYLVDIFERTEPSA